MTMLEDYIKDNRDQLDLDSPPAGVWDGVEARLNKKRKQGPVWVRYAAVAGVFLVLGFMASVFFPSANSVMDEQLVAKSENTLGLDEQRKDAVSEASPPVATENYGYFSGGEYKHELVYRSKNSEGEVIANSNGGTQPYTYNWSAANKSGLSTRQGWANGTYVVSVQDANGCANEQGTTGNNAWRPTIKVPGEGFKSIFGSGDVEIRPNGSAQGFFESFDSGAEVHASIFCDGGSAVFNEAIPENMRRYNPITENDFLLSLSTPVSTFSIDVDAASYSNMRRQLNSGYRPDPNSIRLEEMINYFDYDYPQPTDEHPFSITTEMGECPWNPEHKLVLVGLQGLEMEQEELPASNLVFLIDVSGSMDDADKLPLLKESFKLLVEELDEDDRVSIVVYAGAAGVVLEPTPGNERSTILQALNNLDAGGSTAGGEGIELAYKLAQDNFRKDGNNRVILATDGDFNVGIYDQDGLVELIEEKRKDGVYLSVLGFGTGNYQDGKMEQLADNGNGNCNYIDNLREANKVLVKEMSGTLVTIAKDVKLQVEFNPAQVQAYRLLGYENRVMAREDFYDDTKDAGELGAGHEVTALYEVVLCGDEFKVNSTPDLKYQTNLLNPYYMDEVLTVKFRYKKPDSETSILMADALFAEDYTNSSNLKWAAAVTEFGMLLRNSKYRAGANPDQVIALASANKGIDEYGYRTEFIELVKAWKRMVAGN